MKPAPALLQAGERLLVDETKLDLAQLRVDPANERATTEGAKSPFGASLAR